jgi:hypothetical protein
MLGTTECHLAPLTLLLVEFSSSGIPCAVQDETPWGARLTHAICAGALPPRRSCLRVSTTALAGSAVLLLRQAEPLATAHILEANGHGGTAFYLHQPQGVRTPALRRLDAMPCDPRR